MINRELIRLKVVQMAYAFTIKQDTTPKAILKEFELSLSKAYELYLYLLSLLVELRKRSDLLAEIDEARRERLHLSPEVTPQRILSRNAVLVLLEENATLSEYREEKKQVFAGEETLVKNLCQQWLESDLFRDYLALEERTYEDDCNLVRRFYKYFLVENEDLDDILEDNSLYWNDDKGTIDSFVLKTLKKLNPEDGAGQALQPEYKVEEDHQYATDLMAAFVNRFEETRDLVRANCRNWDFERLAPMDVIIMQVALTEILAFPTIPLRVSLNEYINIAKSYSTPRSASYINGLLDHIVKKLQAEGNLLKN